MPCGSGCGLNIACFLQHLVDVSNDRVLCRRADAYAGSWVEKLAKQ
jgi:hypothetical protein